jgi:hypothetical protein
MTILSLIVLWCEIQLQWDFLLAIYSLWHGTNMLKIMFIQKIHFMLKGLTTPVSFIYQKKNVHYKDTT